MVSLIEREKLIEDISREPLLDAFYRFALGLNYESRNIERITSTQDIILVTINSIKENNIQDFERALKEIEKRRPRPSSDWPFDDILIFSLILGCRKFQRSSDMISELLEIRNASGDTEKKGINEQFSYFLRNTEPVITDWSFIYISLQSLIDEPISKAEYADNAYQTLNRTGYFNSLSPFCKILAYKSIDYIIINKKLDDPDRYKRRSRFFVIFEKRIRCLSEWCSFIVFVFFAAITFFPSIWTYYSDDNLSGFIDALIEFRSFIGVVGLAAILGFRKKTVDWIGGCLFKYFSYSN